MQQKKLLHLSLCEYSCIVVTLSSIFRSADFHWFQDKQKNSQIGWETSVRDDNIEDLQQQQLIFYIITIWSNSSDVTDSHLWEHLLHWCPGRWQNISVWARLISLQYLHLLLGQHSQGGLILMIQTMRQNSFLPSIRAFKILVISSLKNVQNENEDKSPAIWNTEFLQRQ